MSRFRACFEADKLEHSRTEFSAHHSLSCHMGCQEESFEERTVGSGIGTHFSTKARCSPHIGAAFHQVFSAADIGTGRSQTAAGVFNEGTGCNIGTQFNRLFFIGKLAVAVIHKADGVRIFSLHCINDFFHITGK